VCIAWRTTTPTPTAHIHILAYQGVDQLVVSIITQAEEITEAGDLGYPCIIRSRRVRTLYTACLCCQSIHACSYHLSFSLSLCGQGDVFTNIAKDLVPSPKPKHFVAFFKAKYPSWTEVVFRKDLTLSIDLLKFDKIMVCYAKLARLPVRSLTECPAENQQPQDRNRVPIIEAWQERVGGRDGGHEPRVQGLPRLLGNQGRSVDMAALSRRPQARCGIHRASLARARSQLDLT